MNISEELEKRDRASNPPAIHRLDYIDGFRGLACLMVILCHLDVFAPWHFSFKVAHRQFSFSSGEWFIGYVGVNLFLVLSGFCLYWPLVRPGRKAEPSLADFAKRRARRILPPYYVACGFAAVIASFSHTFTSKFLFKWLAIHALLLQMSIPGYIGKILEQVWSIALEASCYLFFPLFVEAFKRFNPRLVLAALALFNGLYRYKVADFIDLTPDTWLTAFSLANNVFGRCFEFAMGMFAARCVSKWIIEGHFPLRVYDLAALVPAIWKVQAPIFDPHNAPRLGATSDIAWGVLFGMLIIISSKSFSMRKILAFPILVWGGEISYSVYLVHIHVLMFFTGLFSFSKWPPGLPLIAELLIVIPLCFVVGYIFFRLFEKPFLSRRSPPIQV